MVLARGFVPQPWIWVYTPAVAFEAFEPPFVYKPRYPLHPLGSSVFILSIQSIRLIGSPDIYCRCVLFVVCIEQCIGSGRKTIET